MRWTLLPVSKPEHGSLQQAQGQYGCAASPEFPAQTDDTQLHIPLRDTKEATVNKVFEAHIFIPRYSL